MKLSDFVVPTATVQLPGGDTFVVRGLALVDLVLLASKYREGLSEFFSEMKVRLATSGEAGLATSALVGMIADAPTVAAETIALAMDEPDAAVSALRLPLELQVELLTAIWGLTFTTEEGPKKLLLAAARAAIQGTKSLNSTLTDGSGESGAK